MIQTESFLMRFFRGIRFNRIAWSLRRIYCPVKKDDLVLEVGSGGNPYFRANILCDAYLDTKERFYVPLIKDRPIVIASGENLPFKDNAFDFVIASHVLEHSIEPEKFLNELQRVAKAGYIETPDAVMERLTHYTFHRLEITERNGELLIRKKRNYIQDEELTELFDKKAINVFPELVSKYPFYFHVRYYWSKDKGGIKFKIINPDHQFDWESPEKTEKLNIKSKKLSFFLKNKILLIIRKIFSQNKRNRRINLMDVLMCNQCKKSDIGWGKQGVSCKNCGNKYLIYGIRN